jgi:beta-glucosidase
LNTITAAAFGNNFHWGVAMAAAQNEGAYKEGGKGLSVWDVFARRRGKIKNGDLPFVSANFYHYYYEDLLMAKDMGFTAFRFSISWSRILPDGTGRVNKQGLQFYHRLIDACLALNMVPFVTIYHWDHPYVLEQEGGWTSPLMLKWFSRYTKICAEHFGDKVKNWIVLNEPLSFTALGYMLGIHAPGKKGLSNFIPAIHNAALAQAEGGRILRSMVAQANIGTSFSCSEVLPYTTSADDKAAAHRLDILMNRLFIEPALGMGFPYEEQFPFLQKLHLQTKAWRYTEKMKFDFDFIGLQHYFPVVVKYNPLIPVIQASEVKAPARNVPYTAMKWEVNPESFYRIVKRFGAYENIKAIIITENGAAYIDKMEKGAIKDGERIAYFKSYLNALLKAKKEGLNIKGYFVWTLTDNFEWSEGYTPKFGLIQVNFKTQQRLMKESGYWWQHFLTG